MINQIIFSFFFWSFPHYVDKMEIFVVIFFCSWNDSWSWDCWFSCFLSEHSPIVFFFVEVTKSIVWDTVSYANIYTIWRQNSMNLIQISFRIWSASITTKNWVEAGFIDNSIKWSIFILERSSIHLFENQLRNSILIVILLLLNYSKWVVNILNILETIFKHFLRKLWVSTSNNQNLKVRLDILCDHVFNAGVSLIPIEWFLIFLISLIPVLWFTVLCHL